MKKYSKPIILDFCVTSVCARNCCGEGVYRCDTNHHNYHSN